MLDRDISTNDALAHLTFPETDPHAIDRRRFLQLVGMGIGAGALAGPATTLLDELVLPGHDPSAWAAGPIGPDDGILVVVGMFGGNDGLNTIVQFDDGDYYRMHGELAIAGADTLPLDGRVGLNAELIELKRFWDQGSLAIVEGVGYPNPDLSHFNSMAFWMSGRPFGAPTTGWLGRWLDGYLGGTTDLYAAAEVGYGLPLHLVGAQQRGTVVTPNRPIFGVDNTVRSVLQYDALRDLRDQAKPGWATDISQAFVDQLGLAATLSPFMPPANELSTTSIVAGLDVAARIINANLGFRVVTAGWGDFDSHADQPEMHGLRLREFDEAIRRFFELLDPVWEDRVTVMTFSEFGRTPWFNFGMGTDHGTSAPQFVFGRNVRGGRYGQPASLRNLERWDRMEHHVDYRSYYASVIDGWLGGGSRDVLGADYENLGLFHGGPGASGGWPTSPPPVVGGSSTLTPMQPFRIVDTRDGTGGVPTRPLAAQETIRVQISGVNGIPTTGVTAVVANVVAVDATTPMHFRIFPGGTPLPASANLNGGPGRPTPNLSLVKLGDDGTIEVYNSHGSTHCVIDIFGYTSVADDTRFVPAGPVRLFDTRDGTGIREGKILDRTPVDIQVAGRAGIPASGATAVVLNLAVTEPESRGYLRLTPSDATVRETANVNFFAGDTVPNLVICKLGPDGKVTLDGRGDGVHAIGDVFGYFSETGDRMWTTPPQRVLDTRDGTGIEGPRTIGPDRPIRVPLAGRAGISANATAVVLNVAATNVAARSFIAVYPFGEEHPGTANLNVKPGRNIANLVVCRLGVDGALTFDNRIADCDVVADVFGYTV